jgi:excinuclease UvrABC helicase subunit UvrB
MQEAMSETERRRALQHHFNQDHGITPQTIIKSLDTILHSIFEADYIDLQDDPIELMLRDSHGTTKRHGRKKKKSQSRKSGKPHH